MPAIHKKYYFRKNLFGGFNRNDVISYMASQSRQEVSRKEDSEREQSQLNRQIAELSDKLAGLSKELDSALEKLHETTCKLEEANAQIEACAPVKDKYDALCTEIDHIASEDDQTDAFVFTSPALFEISSRLAALKEESEILKGANGQLSEKLAASSCKVSELSAEVDELKTAIEEKDAKLSALNEFKSSIGKLFEGNR